MLGTADQRTFAVGLLLFPMLSAPGALALPGFTGQRGVRVAAIAVSIAQPALADGSPRADFANTVGAHARAHREAARRLGRAAGVFLVGFGIKRTQ